VTAGVLRISALLGMLLACLGAATPAQAAPTLPAGFQDALVTPVDRATSIAFAPGGRMLIARVPGVIRMYRNGVLDPVGDPALDISAQTCSDGERGLMSVAVDPAFEANHFVYVYYTHNKSGCITGSATTPVNRVSRFVLGDNDKIDKSSETVLIDNIPAPQTYHIGADLGFGKDGFLYVSTGDGGCDYAGGGCLENNDASRDQHVLLGKVLRITRDGAIPASNPYQGAGTARCNVAGRTTAPNKCQETFAWGLRNPFRLAFDPNATGTRFFINDVGEITWEEIDLAAAGADYGWNVREGFCATGSATNCGAPPAGMTNPIHAYDHSACSAITGGAFVPKGAWPAAYDDDYLYADTTCGRMWRLSPRAGGGYDQLDFGTGFGDYSVMTMTFGPYRSGVALYYATWNHEGLLQVRRISYEGADRAGYARSKGATPLRASLVPAFNPCAAANRTHGPPLAYGSCSPPAQTSTNLTVGTPDANGRAANAVGSVRLEARPGDPGTTPDEADMAVGVSITDVRRRSDLGDYAGQLVLRLPLRLTDRDNGGPAGFSQGTLEERNFDATVPCTVTADGAIGATCSLATTADAVTPGVAVEGNRAIWQLGAVQILDGGADGVASTAPNALFARQGIFVP
jgi:glucose/arabinose dehydrogenase